MKRQTRSRRLLDNDDGKDPAPRSVVGGRLLELHLPMSPSTRGGGEAGNLAYAASILAASAVTALATFALTKSLDRRQLDKAQQLRHEERTGRIRAEVRLRTALKDLKQARNDSKSEESQSGSLGKGEGVSATSESIPQRSAAPVATTMTMRSIGVVVSPFAKRMGTPRQPQLVPSARGYIEFSVPPSCLDGIEEYSHAWVIFEFHANTNAARDAPSSTSSAASSASARTKIRPPRAPHKVGQLATRSPHRPNPLGLSLVTVDSWDAQTRRLRVSSLDLVSGTPVYDVKPFVPWDVPGFVSHPDVVSSLLRGGVVRAPAWVVQEDALARVQFEPRADRQLRGCVEAGRLAPLYTAANGGLEAARSLLVEVLQQDPRSSHRGLKDNRRGSAESSPVDYTMIVGRCQVSFAVAAGGVTVTKVVGVDLDPDTTMYAEGIPLLMAQGHQVT